MSMDKQRNRKYEVSDGKYGMDDRKYGINALKDVCRRNFLSIPRRILKCKCFFKKINFFPIKRPSAALPVRRCGKPAPRASYSAVYHGDTCAVCDGITAVSS